jgi:putative transposase
MDQRKITYRMYPTASEIEKLLEHLGLHQRLYNTALEERIAHYKETGKSLSYNKQAKSLTMWRNYSALGLVNAQSEQNTLKRLDRAYQAFFRRVKAGETACFPRFKAIQRYSGWGYNTYGDGWKLFQNQTVSSKTGKPEFKNGTVRLSGIGEIALRGRGRFTGTPKTAEVIHKAGKWYLSATYNVETSALARKQGTEAGAFDWGLETLLTIAKVDGSLETVDNPRWLKNQLVAIKALQRTVSVEEIKAKASLGLKPEEPLKEGQRLPISSQMKRLYKQIGALHSKAARQRHDFYHKLTATLVSRFAFLGTEGLQVTNMSKAPKAKPDPDKPGEYLPNGASRKAGLNRSINDAAPSRLIGMLKTKAVEAASLFALANTRKLKPTQRCHCCGTLVKKELNERIHQCSCGCTCGRDENAAKTILRWLLEGDCWVGTAQTGSGSGSVLSEIPSYNAFGV